jgi:hypothetical protein
MMGIDVGMWRNAKDRKPNSRLLTFGDLKVLSKVT